MLRLVLAELGHNLRLWLGGFIVISAASVFLALAAGMLATAFGLHAAGSIGEDDLEGMVGFAAVPAFLVAVTTVLVVTSVARLTVTEQRRSYALWQLAGMSPRQVTTVVLSQLAVLSLLGSVLGLLIAWPFLQPLFTFLGKRVGSLAGLEPVLSPAAAAAVMVFSIVLALAGGFRPARQAGATPPIEALRSPETARNGMGILRWFWCSMLLAAGVGLSTGLQSIRLAGIGSNGFLVAFVFGCAAAAAGPLLVPLVLRAWTACFPASMSPEWFLARNAARHRVGQSAGAVIPLALGLILVGSFSTVLALFQRALALSSDTPGQPSDTAANLVIYGAPLLLATAAAAVTVFMTGRARERENALVTATGATHSTIVRTAVLEAVVYTVTAALLSVLVLVPSLAVVTTAINRAVPGTGFVLVWLPWAGLAGVGLIALLISTVIPTLYANRTSIRAALAD